MKIKISKARSYAWLALIAVAVIAISFTAWRFAGSDDIERDDPAPSNTSHATNETLLRYSDLPEDLCLLLDFSNITEMYGEDREGARIDDDHENTADCRRAFSGDGDSAYLVVNIAVSDEYPSMDLEAFFTGEEAMRWAYPWTDGVIPGYADSPVFLDIESLWEDAAVAYYPTSASGDEWDPEGRGIGLRYALRDSNLSATFLFSSTGHNRGNQPEVELTVEALNDLAGQIRALARASS